MSYTNGPRFPMGRPVITPAAQAALDVAGIEGVLLLARHIHGDWGDLSAEDLASNELALLTGTRLLSSYKLPGGSGKVWIITEADRSVTTILLPEEY
ncbi:plasmid related protein [Burkholderia pseudomallei]|nr:plasmid related protein [Burkholderia pseudomallei]